MKKFDDIPLKNIPKRDIKERIGDFDYIYDNDFNVEDRKAQALRCLDCHLPFCQKRCPLENHIPDFNDYIFQGDYKNAINEILKTNPFPEITGMLCPAFCESPCVLNVKGSPVSIKDNELFLGQELFNTLPLVPKVRNIKHIAVIGSGIAGLTVAFYLNQAGFNVSVFEKESRIGGLLNYGISDMKFNRKIFEKRIGFLKQEGVSFFTNSNITYDDVENMKSKYDAIVLSKGVHIQNEITQKDVKGIYPAMQYIRGVIENTPNKIDVKDKDVAIIGYGETALDCMSFAIRQQCKSLICYSIYSELILSDSDALNFIHQRQEKDKAIKEEVAQYFKDKSKDYILYGYSQKSIVSKDNKVEIVSAKIDSISGSRGNRTFNFKPNSDRVDTFDVVLYSIGFKKDATDKHSNEYLQTNQQTNKLKDNVYIAGDYRIGASSFAHAIADARKCFVQINKDLKGV